MFEVILREKCRTIYGLSALPAFPRLYTFRKYESSTTEKLLTQENTHGDHAIHYSKSMGTYLVLCTHSSLIAVHLFFTK